MLSRRRISSVPNGLDGMDRDVCPIYESLHPDAVTQNAGRMTAGTRLGAGPSPLRKRSARSSGRGRRRPWLPLRSPRGDHLGVVALRQGDPHAGQGGDEPVADGGFEDRRPPSGDELYRPGRKHRGQLAAMPRQPSAYSWNNVLPPAGSTYMPWARSPRMASRKSSASRLRAKWGVVTVSRPVGGVLCVARRRRGGHPSVRPTWGLRLRGAAGRATRPLFGLAPGGVCRAVRVTPGAGALLPHRFTLTCTPLLDEHRGHRRSVLCGTFLRVTPTGR
jgi:hypothetical protein